MEEIRKIGASEPAETPLMAGSIASEQLLLARPELHHYTTLSGLAGIVQSNALWATHFRDLNDASEVVHLRTMLTHALRSRFHALLQRRQKASFRIKRAIQRSGGLAKSVTDLVESWVNAMYQTTFEGKDGFAFGDPHIVSFCSHAAEPYESEHGLLSQWQGYGGSDGVCAIFGTREMARLLTLEGAACFYTHIELAKAEYAVADFKIEEFCRDILDKSDDFIIGMLDRKAEPSMDDAFSAFVSRTTLLKHQGFREEREVRIVAVPGTSALRNRLTAEHQGPRLPQIKQTRTRPGLGALRRYEALFETLNVKLPIKRVIVGPSLNQEENCLRARAMLASSVPVTCSETPFVGHCSL